jgi:hypothetical protein
MMKYLKWFAFGSSCLGVAIFVPAFASIGQPILAFCAAGGFATLTWFFWHLLPKTNHYRQPMATAKSGGWHEIGGWQPRPDCKHGDPVPPRNWNHRPDEMNRPEPLPPPPPRDVRGRPYIPQPTPETRGSIGCWDRPRAWPDVEDAAGAGLAWARQAAAEEKKELDFRIRALSGFMRSQHRGFDRIDQAEQDLLRHQCELMQGYSAVLGARIANWRDGGGK